MSVDQQFSQWHTPSVWVAAFANHFSSSSWLPVDRLNLRLASTVEVACKQICSSSPAIIIEADREFVKFVKRRAVFELTEESPRMKKSAAGYMVMVIRIYWHDTPTLLVRGIW